MISSGYFRVTKQHLKDLGRQQALTFIGEMLNCGGRIGHYEYTDWKDWILRNLK